MIKEGIVKKIMKIEFVEFYPSQNVLENKVSNKNNFLGTVHIYLIDEEMDIRGISVFKTGASLYFGFPYFNGIDPETKEKTRYPHVRFVNEKKQKEMITFLMDEVKPAIISHLDGGRLNKIPCLMSR